MTQDHKTSETLLNNLSAKVQNECLVIRKHGRTLYLPISEYAKETVFRLFGKEYEHRASSEGDVIPTGLCLSVDEPPFLVHGNYGRIVCVHFAGASPTEDAVKGFLKATYSEELISKGMRDAETFDTRYVIFETAETETTPRPAASSDHSGNTLEFFRDISKKQGDGWSLGILEGFDSSKGVVLDSSFDTGDMIDLICESHIDFGVSALILADWMKTRYGRFPNDVSEILLTLYSCLSVHPEYFSSEFWPDEIIRALDGLDCFHVVEHVQDAIKKMDNLRNVVLPFFLACRYASPAWVMNSGQISLQYRYLVADDVDYRKYEKDGSQLDIILETPVWQRAPRYKTGHGYHCVPRLLKDGRDVFKLVGEHADRIAASMFLSEEQSNDLAGTLPDAKTVTGLTSNDKHKQRAISLMDAIKFRFRNPPKG